MATSQKKSHTETVRGQLRRGRSLNRCGFTLIELLVVMAIIVILMSMITGAGIYAKGAAKRAQARAELQELHNALQKFRIDTGAYPSPIAATEITRWRLNLPQPIQSRLNRRDVAKLLDPWNQPFIYTTNSSNPETYVLYSEGPKTNNAADDIYSGK